MGMTIKQLRNTLKKYPVDWRVQFGPLPLEWNGVGSYRGHYDHPSCSYSVDVERATVADALEDLAALTRGLWTGYKGGEYRYTEDQELHVARYGETTTCFIGSVVSPFDGYVTLMVVSEDD
jgi:hypothetical protein